MVALGDVKPGEKVEILLAQRDMSVSKLAKRIGRSRQVVNKWVTGESAPREDDDWKGIAEFFGLTLEQLLDPNHKISDDVGTVSSPRKLPRTKAEPTGRIKIYGSASAGHGPSAHFDAFEMNVPIEFARDDFGALVVEGDSMMPFLHSSDIAIFKDWYQPKEGSVMAAELGNGDWVIKKVIYEHGRYLLRSMNSGYPDITENFTLSGFLVGYVRDDGFEREIRLNGYGLRPRNPEMT